MQCQRRSSSAHLVASMLLGILAMATQLFAGPATQPSRHWAFVPIVAPVPPGVRDQAWGRNAIDRFVLAKLEAEKLKPSPPADRRTLIRRAYLDLTGLPSSPSEVEEFVGDQHSDAFEKVVDRLLASPAYGQRWGRYWLDIARYSDGFGTGYDGADKPSAWRYRDWVVDALNRDMPYDRFVKMQIAGDLMDAQDGPVATGFLFVGPTFSSDGGDPESVAKAEADTLEDRIDTTFRGVMGLTVACARCHDHKFDPIPTQDYYSIAGIFRNTHEIEKPTAPPEEVKKFDEGQKTVREAAEKLGKWLDEQTKAGGGKLSKEQEARHKEMTAEVEALRKNAPPKYPFVHSAADQGSADMPVALRGNLLKPGEMAPRRFLSLVSGSDRPHWTHGSGRLDLAEALVARNDPLTARVIANRVWMYHFGQGIVRSPSDFGSSGEHPTHPELLDWLASHLMDSNWSLKTLHRTIMLSATYQMSSDTQTEYLGRDGDNRMLWRMSARRLDVEAWRDSILSVTGELDRALGGKPTVDLLESNRRTLYSVISRNGDRFDSDRFLHLFDLPKARMTSAKRDVSIVPQQYLFMLNSKFMEERARALSSRLDREQSTDAGRIDLAYRLLYCRPPQEDEVHSGLDYLSDGVAAGAKPPAGRWERYARVLLCADEFLFVQ